MKKTMLAVIMAVVMVCGIPVYAGETSEKEIALDNRTVETVQSGIFTAEILEDDTVIITEVDSYNDFCEEIPAEIEGYPVSGIGHRAFEYMEFEELIIPESVSVIEEDAFAYVTVTDVLSLPENIRIEADAFSYACLPEKIIIPKGAYAGTEAFAYLEGTENLQIEEGAVIGKDCFAYACDLENVTIGANAEIGEGAFSYCDYLESVTVGDGTSLAENAFEYCPTLDDIDIAGGTEGKPAISGGEEILLDGNDPAEDSGVILADGPDEPADGTESILAGGNDPADETDSDQQNAFSDYYDYENPDGTYSYYFTRGVVVTMDKDWYQKTIVRTDSGGATFYHKASYKAYQEQGYKGGRLFTISASVNTDFQNLPSFEYIGFNEEECMNYFAILPTDYQAYAEDDSIRAEYDSLWSGVKDVIAGIELIEGSGD